MVEIVAQHRTHRQAQPFPRAPSRPRFLVHLPSRQHQPHERLARSKPWRLVVAGTVVARMSQSLKRYRRREAIAHDPSRTRRRAPMPWTKERLAASVRERLGGAHLIVVANREPYIHTY